MNSLGEIRLDYLMILSSSAVLTTISTSEDLTYPLEAMMVTNKNKATMCFNIIINY